MTNSKRSLAWIILHLSIIGLSVTSLLTGMRIAALSRPEVLHFSALLPQGYLHEIHLLSAFGLVSVIISYSIYLIFFNDKSYQESKKDRLHLIVVWFGYAVILGSVTTGIVLYFNLISSVTVVNLHYAAALAFIVYFVLHTGLHLSRHGLKAFKTIIIPKSLRFKESAFILTLVLGIFSLLYVTIGTKSSHQLTVTKIPNTVHIDIDGQANESQWKDTQEIKIWSFGGENFYNGSTQITVKALHNEREAFFNIRWNDPTKSMRHLPLVKTEKGWKVIENGFYNYNEVDNYEDKLAVIISNDCSFGASKTAHLGPKPLSDKPKNWHGRGYHYTHDGSLHDLWHWKAVRTNDMILADDNYISSPDIIRPGSRRYTAGYLADGKESGAYVMNWQWYKPTIIVPKRLPKNPETLKPYQENAENSTEPNWVVPWYHYELYDPKNDTYPVGTIIPSVLYASNRFEGDRAHVRARATWENGVWSLELVRPLLTGSHFDVPLKEGVCMWIAAFDHAQIAHTRHNQPICLHFGDAL